MKRTWAKGVPTDVDLKHNAMPRPARKHILSAHETETHRISRNAGLELNMDPDESGTYVLTCGQLGGFNCFVTDSNFAGLDVSCAKLIREGTVAVKQGVEAARFTKDFLNIQPARPSPRTSSSMHRVNRTLGVADQSDRVGVGQDNVTLIHRSALRKIHVRWT
ncbi:hypothetical protein DFH07DRAFT_846146 [Mycena maculata]|uniref:Uncharacterized protein n=1 Tax=Mycena maculata TaxID=230809 RepID=A0AAD7MUQ4_9AGAR|nr:hypothetical protein DFH07DRAFT_846146 [Mycena maculata]